MNSISLILGFISGISVGLFAIGKEGRKDIKNHLLKRELKTKYPLDKFASRVKHEN